MSIISVELPESLTRQIETQRVSREELQSVVATVVEMWLAQRGQREDDSEKDRRPGRFSESAVPFARRLISRNRALFEELAGR